MSLMQKHGLWTDIREAEKTGSLLVHFFRQQACPRVGGGAYASLPPEALGYVSWTEASIGCVPPKVEAHFAHEELGILHQEVLDALLTHQKQMPRIAPR